MNSGIMNRDDALRHVGEEKPWDVLVVGGGATGLGTALDAATRGYRTLLLEQDDFAKGTSSRSTKLAHGGVRYLQQGNVALVLEALKERGRMLHNAPHLVHRQSFVIPAESLWQVPFFAAGLKLYDALSGRSSFGSSRVLSHARVRAMLRGASVAHVRGGIQYFDGQFDDARMALALAQTASEYGATVLNYARVLRWVERDGRVCGAIAEDRETGQQFSVEAKVSINATGVFSDVLRSLDEPHAAPLLAVSQGTHIVLPRSFLAGTDALMVPRTVDGRVLFAIPWHGAVVVGTTDEPVEGPALEPRSLPQEREFLLNQIERYFGRRPRPEEILSMWSGQRPLVRRQGVHSTAALSREHSVLVSRSGLVTVVGGKWTTYRRMGQDTVDIAARSAGLPARSSQTADLHLHGWLPPTSAAPLPIEQEALALYGSDRARIEAMMQAHPELALPLDAELPYCIAEVLWAVQQEMARTVEDVLARRTRSLFLHARAAIRASATVARILAQELGRSPEWEQQQVQEFQTLARGYLCPE